MVLMLAGGLLYTAGALSYHLPLARSLHGAPGRVRRLRLPYLAVTRYMRTVCGPVRKEMAPVLVPVVPAHRFRSR
jgi:hypothetical protein